MIREAVARRGLNLAELSQRNGLGRETLSGTLSAGKRFPRQHRIIAEFVGVELHEIWPKLYPPGPYQDGRARDATRYDHLLARIEAGGSLRGVCAEPGMPTRDAVRKFAARNPDFRDRVAKARASRRNAPGPEPEKVIERVIARVSAGELVNDLVAQDRTAVRLLRKRVNRDPILLERWTTALGPRHGARISVARRNAALDELRVGGRVKRLESLSAATLRAYRRRDPAFAAAYDKAFGAGRNVAAATRESFVRALRSDEVYAVAMKATSWVPWEMREDVTSDLVVAMLSGRVQPENARAAVDKIVTAYNRLFGRRDISMDAELGDGEGFTFGGLVTDPSAFDTDGTSFAGMMAPRW